MENSTIIDATAVFSSRRNREEDQPAHRVTEQKPLQGSRDTQIVALYTERLWPLERIANEYGLSTGGIRKILRGRGIPLRPPQFRSPKGPECLGPLHRTLAANISYYTEVQGRKLPLGARKITALRSGTAEISLTELLRIASALGCEVADLLKKDRNVPIAAAT